MNRGFETAIPARLDRLPWSRFHAAVILALGITWTLDGLEVTIVGAMGGVLQDSRTLHLSAAEIGAGASFYVAGAVLGALVFGWLTDSYGRRKIFYANPGGSQHTDMPCRKAGSGSAWFSALRQ